MSKVIFQCPLNTRARALNDLCGVKLTIQPVMPTLCFHVYLNVLVKFTECVYACRGLGHKAIEQILESLTLFSVLHKQGFGRCWIIKATEEEYLRA